MFGKVIDHDGKPIFMVKISVYRDGNLIEKEYTGDDGDYNLEIAGEGPITVLFDMHPTLNGADNWHPSVVSNIIPAADLRLDRTLSRTGNDLDDASAMDALSAYQFAAMWLGSAPEEYAPAAARRLGTIKFANRALHEIQYRLIHYFDGSDR